MLAGYLGAMADDADPYAYSPRVLPGQRLTPPVVGLAKESALQPPVNSQPLPPTTPPAFTPRDPSLLALRDADCCFTCGDCCQPCGAYAGIGFYFIQPYWTSNPAFFELTTTGDNSEVILGNQHDFGHDFELAPLAWVGVRCCGGLGVRARWWGYDQSAQSTITDDRNNFLVLSATPLGLRTTDTLIDSATSPETIAADSDLQITVFDLEATQDLQCGCWWITLAGGIRSAHVSQDYNVFHLDDEGELIEQILSGHNFNGAGPTVACEAHRPLCFGLGVFGSTRGSLLYGHAQQSVHLSDDDDKSASYSHETLLPILEVEIGLEWRGWIGCAELFFQSGLVSQTWFGAGNASRSTTPSPGGLPVSPLRSGQTTDDADLGLFGFSFAAGIKY
jgi:hypothetical protein